MRPYIFNPRDFCLAKTCYHKYMEPRLNSPMFLVVTGRLTIIGRQPDGDSVRFIPDHPQTLLRLPRASRLRPASDGSVQLRMDGIDAPETHFLSHAQPYGIEARKQFLRILGFRGVTFSEGGSVTSAEPKTIPATIFIGLLDPYGRPVSYLLLGVSSKHHDGDMISPDSELLAVTVNLQLLTSGATYVTVYSSTPPAQQDFLIASARIARDKKLGVWGLDSTARFELTSPASIDPASGVLILPKLFRRATSYLKAREAGFTGDFPSWIKSTINNVYHSDDDFVIRSDGSVVRFHELVHQTDTTITTELDPLTDIFIEQ